MLLRRVFFQTLAPCDSPFILSCCSPGPYCGTLLVRSLPHRAVQYSTTAMRAVSGCCYAAKLNQASAACKAYWLLRSRHTIIVFPRCLCSRPASLMEKSTKVRESCRNIVPVIYRGARQAVKRCSRILIIVVTLIYRIYVTPVSLPHRSIDRDNFDPRNGQIVLYCS